MTKSIYVMSQESETYLAFEKKVWSIVDILRGEVSAWDYFPIMALTLMLKKEGTLSEIRSYSINEVRQVISRKIDGAWRDKKISNDDQYHSRAIAVADIEFTSFLTSLGNNPLNSLLAAVDDLDTTLVAAYFNDLIDSILIKIGKSEGKKGNFVIQPLELTDLMIKLAELKSGANVYNPFAGVASFGTSLPEGASYFGQEINADTWAKGLFRLLIHGKTGLAKEDSIDNWNSKGRKYDLIVSTPPFNMRVNTETSSYGKVRNVEQFLFAKGIPDLTSTGKLIVVTAHGFLFREGPEKLIRKELVDRDILETVITFPGGLFSNTTIPVCAIVVSNDKKEKGVVRFVDASRYVVSTAFYDKRLNAQELYSAIVTNGDPDSIHLAGKEEIVRNDFNLTVGRYFASPLTSANSVKFGDIATILTTNVLSGVLDQFELSLYRPYNNQMAKSGPPAVGKYVRIRDLKDDRLNYMLDTDSVGQSELPKQSFEVRASALLLALRWNTLKPTFFEYKGESIFISNDIIAMEVDEKKVDIAYLVNELHSNYVLNSVRSLRSGTSVPTLRKQDLFMIEIELPSIEEQRAKIKGVKESLILEKKKELDNLRKIHGLENELLEQNTYLRHSLAGPASNLRGSIKSLRKIMDEHILPLMPHAMDLKESPLSTLNLGKYISIIERDIKKISETLSRTTRVDHSAGEKKFGPIDIIEFLENYVDELLDKKDLKFEISYSIDKETFSESGNLDTKAYIYANVDLLSDLFNNLIENAERHAFTDNIGRVSARRSKDAARIAKYGHNRIEIHLILNSSYKAGREDEYDVIILFSNSGKKFPEGFEMSDFIRKGSKSGPNAGDGFGGWYINDIIKKMSGELNIYFDPGKEGLDEELATTFEITLPVIQFESDENL